MRKSQELFLKNTIDLITITLFSTVDLSSQYLLVMFLLLLCFILICASTEY